MKTFIVYDLDSKMPVAVGEQVSAETARYCASEITGTFHANLFAEEIDLEKKSRCYTRIGRLFWKARAEFAATERSKLDFGPPVDDLSNEGFPLIGGRLDYLDNRPVAALVYGRRKQFINCFVWAAASDAAKAPKTITYQGYQLLQWADPDFNYWAVSDVNVNDLQTFKQQFETRTPHH
jgi:hypothetical protein